MAGFFIAYPVGGEDCLNKSLSLGMRCPAGTAMVCLRGESPIHHTNQMNAKKPLLLAGLLLTFVVTGCGSIPGVTTISPLSLSPEMQQYAIDKFAYAHCITGARGLSAGSQEAYASQNELKEDVSEIVNACKLAFR